MDLQWQPRVLPEEESVGKRINYLFFCPNHSPLPRYDARINTFDTANACTTCSRTGVEAMIFATHSTTDLPLQSTLFNTTGLDGFLETTMEIDRTDLLGKMEGFSLRGLKGTFELVLKPLITHFQHYQVLQRITSSAFQNYDLKYAR
jgi:hypothetical protein